MKMKSPPPPPPPPPHNILELHTHQEHSHHEGGPRTNTKRKLAPPIMKIENSVQLRGPAGKFSLLSEVTTKLSRAAILKAVTGAFA